MPYTLNPRKRIHKKTKSNSAQPNATSNSSINTSDGLNHIQNNTNNNNNTYIVAVFIVIISWSFPSSSRRLLVSLVKNRKQIILQKNFLVLPIPEAPPVTKADRPGLSSIFLGRWLSGLRLEIGSREKQSESGSVWRRPLLRELLLSFIVRTEVLSFIRYRLCKQRGYANSLSSAGHRVQKYFFLID